MGKAANDKFKQEIRKAMQLDSRIKVLYETCTDLNRNARFMGWDSGWENTV